MVLVSQKAPQLFALLEIIAPMTNQPSTNNTADTASADSSVRTLLPLSTAPGATSLTATPVEDPATAYKTLLSPIQVGKTTFRNRVVMGSMHTGLEDSIEDVPKLAAFYAARAEGGVAAMVTGGYPPVMEGNLTPYGTPFNTPDIAAAHREITDAVHAGGAKILLQLLHAGRYGYHPMAQSASASQSPISPFPAREMTAEEVEKLIDAYATSAALAADAGYDGVQVMGSEGYLINQFLAERTNQRTDEWGGSVENRQRFPVEIIKAIRAKVPEDFVIDYRISVLELVEGGQSQEEILQLAKKIEEAGADMLSSGVGWHEAQIPTIVTSVPRGAFAWATQKVRDHVDIPVVASNRINTPEVAEAILDGSWDGGDGQPAGDPQADLVSMARPLLADPEFVNRAARGLNTEINHCIACNQACLDHTFGNQRATCLVNPRAAYETELELLPAQGSKKVGVIGGGVAGLFAAEALALRGHDVTVFEAADTLGGQFNLAMRVPGKEEFVQALYAVVNRLEGLKVNISTGKAVTPRELHEDFEEIVVATGVRPRIPEFPGVTEGLEGKIDGVTVATYAELISGEKTPGEYVAVIGAGGIGYDVAEFLLEDRQGTPQTLNSWNSQWGVVEASDVHGNLSTPNPERPQRRVVMLQRKPTRMGRSLGKTTGWVHRATVAMGGTEQIVGVTYEKIDSEGLHITVPVEDPQVTLKKIKQVKSGTFEGRTLDRAEKQELLEQIERETKENREQRVINVDTVVLCTGQESIRPEGAEQEGASNVHIIGGADVAAELDAKRAIRQAVELAARI